MELQVKHLHKTQICEFAIVRYKSKENRIKEEVSFGNSETKGCQPLEGWQPLTPKSFASSSLPQGTTHYSISTCIQENSEINSDRLAGSPTKC